MGFPRIMSAEDYRDEGLAPDDTEQTDPQEIAREKAAQLANTGASEPEVLEGAEPPAFPGLPGSSVAGENDATGEELAGALGRVLNPYVPTGGAPQVTIQPGGERFATLGGAQGRANYDRAFTQYPQEMAGAVMEGAEAESALGSMEADFYKREQGRQADEYAVLRQRQIERQNELALKQQQMEQATERYTNDLADTGKFWRDPRNIVAAIGASLMHLGSDDPTISYKVISKAIENDWNHRKYLADRDRTGRMEQINLYRQIAGDKDIGDRLALLESNRVAGMELQRIAGMMRGPIAKARATAVLKENLAQRELIKMQIYAAMVGNKPQIQNPAILKAYQAEGKAMPENGWQSYTGQAQAAAGQPMTANAPGLPKVTAQGVQGQAPAPQASSKADLPSNSYDKKESYELVGVSPEMAAMAEKRAPGSIRELMSARYDNIRDMLVRSGADPYIATPTSTIAEIRSKLTPQQALKFNANHESYKRSMEEDNKVVAGLMAPITERQNGYRQLGSDIQLIKAIAASLPGKPSPDKLLDTRNSQIYGKSLDKAIDEFLATGTPEGRTEEARASLRRRVMNFKQALQGTINQYTKATSGGNVTAGEEERLAGFIGKTHSFGSVENFHRLISSDVRAAVKTALGAARNPTTRILWRIKAGLDTSQDDMKSVDGPAPTAPGPRERKPYTSDEQRAIDWLKKNGSKTEQARVK